MWPKLLLVMNLIAVHGWAATYFVATNGNDDNPGTEQEPFQHLSRAAAAATTAGDTVVVMDGVYGNEGVVADPNGGGSVVNLRYSGASGAPITFEAQNKGRAVLDAMNTSTVSCNGAWAYFDLHNASFIVIQGFVIQNGCYNGIRSNGHAHDVLIKWNEIRNIGNWANPGFQSSPSGIYLNNTEYNFTFDGNLFHDIGGGTVNQEHAIYTAASNVAIINNVFYNISHGYAIQTSGGANIFIANNTLAFPNPYRNGQIVIWDNGQPGSVSGLTIRDNIFLNPRNVAVVTDLSAPVLGCAIDHNITNVAAIFDNKWPCSLYSNKTSTDPGLADTTISPYNFQLKPGSPAIGAGVYSPNVLTDFNGNPRSETQPDMGAFTVVQAPGRRTFTPFGHDGSRLRK